MKIEKWLSRQGVPKKIVEALVAFLPEKMDEEPIDDFFDADSIMRCNDSNADGLPPDSGFIIVGGCPNGDPVAMDVKEKPGTIWYLSHEQMHSAPLRKVAIMVADSPAHYVKKRGEKGFPWDYWAASKA
jgi:hypothetical protein